MLQPNQKKYLIISTIVAVLVVILGYLLIRNKSSNEPLVIENLSVASCNDDNILKSLRDNLKTELQKKNVVDLQSGITNKRNNYDTNRLMSIFNTVHISVRNIIPDPTVATDGSVACMATIKYTIPADVYVDAAATRKVKPAYNQNCENCEDDQGSGIGGQTLESQALDSQLNYDGTSVSYDHVKYRIQKDTDGNILVTDSDSSELISFVSSAIVDALDLVNATKASQANQAMTDSSAQNTSQKLEIVQKAMALRLAEVTNSSTQANDQLNTLWQAATPQIKARLLEGQREWLKSRDVNCQLDSVRGLDTLKESEKEPYEIETYNWTQAMIDSDKEIRRTLCVAKKTSDRVKALPTLMTAIEAKTPA
jgi:uncharacterized protein YecT (DUF1311 family)